MKTIERFLVSARRWLPALCLTAALTGCDLIEYHPYDSRVDGERLHNAAAIKRIERETAGRETVRFAVISDTQRWYDETGAIVDAINARPDVDFVIHCGDQTDFGLTREWEWMARELKRLRPPYVCLIGNHDCLGTGGDVFRALYGDPNFSFDVGTTHFVCLNTNAFEYDYSTAIPDFDFLRTDRETLPASTRRTVVAMHAAPHTDQFNNNVAEVFQLVLHRYPGLAFCLCGHTHHTQHQDLFGDGIVYHTCGAAHGRTYLLFTLTEDGYTYEEVAC